MTSAQDPVRLQVALDPRWIELPVHEPVEAGEWAAAAVADALAVRGIVEDPRVVNLYVQTYAATLDGLRERTTAVDGVLLAGAYALVGQAELLADTVAELAYVSMEGFDRFEDVVDSCVAPEVQRFADPDVSELDTAFGTAVRVQQLRIVDEGEGREPSLQTSVVYLWPGLAPGRAVMLSAWFGSPVDAETTRPVVDQLAASLREEPA
ncbi:MAG: hypothetical protein WD794_06460 [Mycobacteriales bacterium]